MDGTFNSGNKEEDTIQVNLTLKDAENFLAETGDFLSERPVPVQLLALRAILWEGLSEARRESGCLCGRSSCCRS